MHVSYLCYWEWTWLADMFWVAVCSGPLGFAYYLGEMPYRHVIGDAFLVVRSTGFSIAFFFACLPCLPFVYLYVHSVSLANHLPRDIFARLSALLFLSGFPFNFLLFMFQVFVYVYSHSILFLSLVSLFSQSYYRNYPSNHHLLVTSKCPYLQNVYLDCLNLAWNRFVILPAFRCRSSFSQVSHDGHSIRSEILFLLYILLQR